LQLQNELAENVSIEQLARFLVCLGFKAEQHLAYLWNLYCDCRHWQAKDMAQLIAIYYPLRAKYIADLTSNDRYYLKNVIYKKSFRRKTKIKSEALTLLDGLQPNDFDRVMAADLKNGDTSTVSSWQYKDQHLVIKRYNRKNFVRKILPSFRKSHAARSWDNVHLLQALGVATLRPLALYERWIGFMQRQAYFIYEFLDGLSLCHFFSELTADQYQPYIDSIMRLFCFLFQHQICHGDLKASNLIMCNGTVFLIDLDSLQTHLGAKFSKRWQRDMARFLRNWDKHPELKKLFKQALLQNGLLAGKKR
jgi:tRNA A-37 threonylcarbamoyl transferase component Bud32